MSKLDATIEMIDDTFHLINKGKELDEKFKSKEITIEEYIELNKELNQWYETKLNNFKNREELKCTKY